MKKIAGTIAMVLIVIMLANAYSGCLFINLGLENSSIFPDPPTWMWITGAIIDLIIIAVVCIPLVFVAENNDTPDQGVYLAGLSDPSLFDAESTAIIREIFAALPKEETAALAQTIISLPEKKYNSLTQTVNSMSKEEMAASIQRVHAAPKEEIIDSIQKINAMSEKELAALVEHIKARSNQVAVLNKM